MMGLRLTDGIDLQRFNQIGGKPLNPRTLQELEDMGMIKNEKPYLKATRAGRLVLNAVIAELLLD
jgi:oxygen-independent coproporphyrinogen-3 oxidase